MTGGLLSNYCEYSIQNKIGDIGKATDEVIQLSVIEQTNTGN